MNASTVEKIATWLPMTQESLDDALLVRLNVEYAFYGADVPLTPRERATGYRRFTSSDGLKGTFYVGWRLALYRRLHPPEPEDDCE